MEYRCNDIGMAQRLKNERHLNITHQFSSNLAVNTFTSPLKQDPPLNAVRRSNPCLKYEIIYQLDAIEYLFVFFQLDMFRAYTPIFRSNGCYNFFTYAAYGVLGVVRCRS